LSTLPPHPGLFLRSTHKGRSLFTRTGHGAGDPLFEHHGERLSFAQACRLSPEHIMEIGDDLVLAASGDLDDFINHGCVPNCRVEFRRDGRVVAVALRGIAPGEELTYDYATTTTRDGLRAFPGWRFPCACGAPGCRGEVSCAEDIPVARLEEYIRQGMLAPHVLRRLGVR
jgi:hypothetical protein